MRSLQQLVLTFGLLAAEGGGSTCRPWTRFSVVKYALAAFRYLMTGIVALVLALLLVLLTAELGAAIDAALE